MNERETAVSKFLEDGKWKKVLVALRKPEYRVLQKKMSGSHGYWCCMAPGRLLHEGASFHPPQASVKQEGS